MALKDSSRLARIEVSVPWRRSQLGTVFSAKIIDVDDGLGAAFIALDADSEGFLRHGDLNLPRHQQGKLSQHLKAGQSLVVQVHKAPAPGKRLPCTASIGLAGFHMVFFPHREHIRFSNRFSGNQKLIKSWIRSFEGLKGGWLLRSSSTKVSKEILEAECRELVERWEGVCSQVAFSEKVRVLDGMDAHPIRKFLADCLSLDITNMYLDDEELFTEVMTWAKGRFPFLCDRIFLHSGDYSLFATYGLDKGFHDVSQSKTWLKNGGYLLFNQTDAMTVIDVNSGKSTAGEQKKVQVNLLAAVAAALQIQLRNLGGIIVIDFINMKDSTNVELIEKEFLKSLGDDQKNCRIERINSFGLLCMSRRRKVSSLWETMTEPCHTCKGTGYQKALDLVVIELLSDIAEESPNPEQHLLIHTGSELYSWLQKHDVLGFLNSCSIELKKKSSFHPRQYHIDLM